MTGMALDDFFFRAKLPGEQRGAHSWALWHIPKASGSAKRLICIFLFCNTLHFFFKQPEHPNPNVLMSDGRFQGLCFAIYLTHRERVVTLLLEV